MFIYHTIPRYIKIIFLLITVFFIASLLFYFTVIYTPSYKVTIDNNAIDNCINNEAYGHSNLVQINNKLYYGYSNHLLKNGVYEITSDSTKRIFFDWSLFDNSMFNYKIYKNNMINPYVDDENNILYYDMFWKRDKTLIKLDDSKPYHSLFVINDELYLTADIESSYCIYKYNDGTPRLVASSELCGDGFFPYAYCNNYIYYTNEVSNSIEDDIITKSLLKYDMNTQKNIGKVNINEKGYIIAMIGFNDRVYYAAMNNVLMTSYIVEVDFSTSKKTQIYSTDGGFFINGYNDTLFLLICGGNEQGIYKLNDKSKKFELLFNDCTSYVLGSLYIVDNNHLYFTDEKRNLFRIDINGNNYQKVFGLKE